MLLQFSPYLLLKTVILAIRRGLHLHGVVSASISLLEWTALNGSKRVVFNHFIENCITFLTICFCILADISPGRGNKPCCFKIYSPCRGQPLEVASDSETDMSDWITNIRACAENLQDQVLPFDITITHLCNILQT